MTNLLYCKSVAADQFYGIVGNLLYLDVYLCYKDLTGSKHVDRSEIIKKNHTDTSERLQMLRVDVS